MMSEIHQGIVEGLDMGKKPATIAAYLNVPVDWVYSVEEAILQEELFWANRPEQVKFAKLF